MIKPFMTVKKIKRAIETLNVYFTSIGGPGAYILASANDGRFFTLSQY